MIQNKGIQKNIIFFWFPHPIPYQIPSKIAAMDVINKLYSSVSNTVSQLSSVLPGNPITKEFDIGEHIGSAGPGNVLVR